MADRIFYTFYRFFEGMHGPGDAAEVAALFTWCCLLFFNIASVIVLLLVAFGNPTGLRSYIPHAFGFSGLIVVITQGIRYLAKGRIRKLYDTFSLEPSELRIRRRWISFGYSTGSVVLFIGSLWLLGTAG